MVQCSLYFYNKKTAQTVPYLYINIYFFNIKYIIVGEQFGDPVLVVQVLVQKVQHNEFL